LTIRSFSAIIFLNSAFHLRNIPSFKDKAMAIHKKMLFPNTSSGENSTAG
jgi:hypothetical protein